jgi:hypothetical protein
MPITSIQIDLFVGEPVKNLETSEEKDCDALTPKIINATPAASSASPRTLFMCFISVFVGVDSSAPFALSMFPRMNTTKPSGFAER